MEKKNTQIKGIFVLSMLVCASFGTAFILSSLNVKVYAYDLKTFESYETLIDFLRNKYGNATNYAWDYSHDGLMISMSKTTSAERSSDEGGTSVDFSRTNIQVEGVDEPDIVKTDGTYLYIIANQTIFIVQAYPAETAIILAKISLGNNCSIEELFINDDHLVVFGTSTRVLPVYEEYSKANPSDYGYWGGGISTTIIKVYNIADKENPELMNDISVDGYYFDSRMIDTTVYVITTEPTYEIYRALDSEGNVSINIPQTTVNGVTETIPAEQIYYVDAPENADTMTHVLSLNINDATMLQKSFMLGSAQTMYVSNSNIYLAYTQYNYAYPLLERPYGRSEEKTILYKISISNGDISYVAQGDVPGRVLNQFSMDEYNGYFRIATTVGQVWDEVVKSSNNVYILNDKLERVSQIEDIAPGEQIHSARFMGGKAYLVTFKKIDPFFTLDLSDPQNPKILGKLKIPGYSDYLHPYDENHIIGIGKETADPTEEESQGRSFDFAWYQGLKIALFDVSDFENPKEVAKIVIGDRGTDSPALYDHKAFLFDREKGLLVIPVALYEIPEEIKEQQGGYTGSLHGEFTFQGAYVYRLTLENGFEYKGRITHMTQEDQLKQGYYWYYGYVSSDISRSLYIGNILYTISGTTVKMNNLDTLDEINGIQFV